MSVIVKISRRATVPAALQIYPRRQRHIGKLAVAQIPQQPARSIRHTAHKEKVRFAIALSRFSLGDLDYIAMRRES